ncbi:MAG TPA: hypothetical protein VHF27_04350 [Acidimicrobiales bacterium]|nr:hypothetical protein [Acidimicrobiales bacterium]
MVLLAAVGLTVAAVGSTDERSSAVRGEVGTTAPGPPSTTAPAPATTAPPSTIGPTEAVATPLPGCPPPPRRPGTGTTAPTWRPPVLVPEVQLPPAHPAPAVTADTAVLEGKGMWIWKHRQTEAGDTDAVVARAKAAGLTQLWVRVGDSRDGFYAADYLSSLVPKAQRAGLAVIGWGFPFLHDPVSDAQWSIEAVSWRGPDGSRLDGFSPDIELASEGVVLTERRITVYLGLVRPAGGDMPLVATVYRATDARWNGSYPYRAIAPYVDAFAPMVYWGCVEPGRATLESVERLATLKPVHVIGQGYDAGPEGGRAGAPSAAETVRFLDVARRSGAIGASMWVWQSMPAEQWDALSTFVWPLPRRSGD